MVRKKLTFKNKKRKSKKRKYKKSKKMRGGGKKTREKIRQIKMQTELLKNIELPTHAYVSLKKSLIEDGLKNFDYIDKERYKFFETDDDKIKEETKEKCETAITSKTSENMYHAITAIENDRKETLDKLRNLDTIADMLEKTEENERLYQIYYIIETLKKHIKKYNDTIYNTEHDKFYYNPGVYHLEYFYYIPERPWYSHRSNRRTALKNRKKDDKIEEVVRDIEEGKAAIERQRANASKQEKAYLRKLDEFERDEEVFEQEIY